MIALHDFFTSKKEWLDKYDEIIVYYDNGQLPIKYAVTSLFALLFKSYEMRKVLPVDYRLFQTADMICTMYVMDAKYRNHPMSNSEKIIFNSKYDFYHDFFNPFKAKEIKWWVARIAMGCAMLIESNTQAVYMIPGWTHNIINLSETENLVTVMTCNEIFNKDRPDTFFEIVK